MNQGRVSNLKHGSKSFSLSAYLQCRDIMDLVVILVAAASDPFIAVHIS